MRVNANKVSIFSSLLLNGWLVIIVLSFFVNGTMWAFFYTDSAFGTFFFIDLRIICKDWADLSLLIFTTMINHMHLLILNEYNCFAHITHNRAKSINVKYLDDRYILYIL